MRIYENLKSIILTLLIGISLILTGSLWFDNYYGLSLAMSDMVSFFYPKIDLEDTEYIKEYLVPYKTTIANGDNGKWIYYVSSKPNQKAYEYVKELLMSITDFTVDSAYDSEWENLINRKTIICEFAGEVDIKVLNLILSNKLEFSNSMPIHISALAITKTTTGGRIYIKADDIIYRITVNGDLGDFDQIISEYSDFTTYAKYVQLDELGVENFNGREINTEFDALLPISAKSSNRHPVSRLIKNSLLNNNIEKIEEKVTKIFGSNQYIKFITEEDGYIYINDDESIIRILEDDMIEYTSQSSLEFDEEITWISSFNTAIRFIDVASELNYLYLISALNNDNVYEFVFGTYINEIPVVDSNNVIFDNDKAKIYVKVSNNVVVNYKEKLQTFLDDFESVYLSKFAHNILDDILVNIPKKAAIKIKSIELVYDVSTDNVLPVWKIEYEYNNESKIILTEAAKLRNY